MAIFLLDTTTVTLLQHRHPRASAQLLAHTGQTVVISTVTVEETLGGWYASLRQSRTNAEQARAASLMADSYNFLAQFRAVPLTEPALDTYDRLVRMKLNVGRMDLKIAALGLELGATIVTNNLRDFGRVSSLLVEDWTA